MIACDLQAPLAHELHRPVGVVAAAVCHPREVGHEGREPPLAVPERSLRALPLRDVADVDGDPVLERVGQDLEPDAERLAELLEGLDGPLRHRPVEELVAEGIRRCGELVPEPQADQVLPAAPEPLEVLPRLRVQEGEPPLAVDREEGVGDAVEDLRRLLVRLLELDLGPLAIGDVLEGALVADDLAARVADRPRRVPDPDRGAVLAPHLDLEAADEAVPLDQLPPALAGFRVHVAVDDVRSEECLPVREGEHPDERPVPIEELSVGGNPVQPDGNLAVEGPVAGLRLLHRPPGPRALGCGVCGRRLHLGGALIHARSVAALRLGAAEGLVHCVQKLGWAPHRRVVGCDPRAHRHLDSGGEAEVGDGVAGPLGEDPGPCRLLARQDREELVAPVAAGHVHPPGVPVQHRRDLLKRLVSDSVPVRLVVRPEAVDIEEHDREEAAALRGGELLLDDEVEQAPVRKPGQRIAVGEDERGRPLPLQELREHPQPQAQEEKCCGHQEEQEPIDLDPQEPVRHELGREDDQHAHSLRSDGAPPSAVVGEQE